MKREKNWKQTSNYGDEEVTQSLPNNKKKLKYHNTNITAEDCLAKGKHYIVQKKT